MALAVSDDGRVAVLDQVNARVLVLTPGRTEVEHLSLPRATFQELVWDAGGRLWALDRLGQPELRALTGGPATLTTLGDGVAEGASITGLFAGTNGLWAETEHAELVQLTDVHGLAVSERAVLPGRFGHDTGILRSVARAGERRVVVTARLPDTTVAFRHTIELPLPVLGVREWRGTADGRTVVVVASALQRDTQVLQERLTAVVLAPSGVELRRLELPPPTEPDEQFRPLQLTADGSLYLLRCVVDAAEVWRFVP